VALLLLLLQLPLLLLSQIRVPCIVYVVLKLHLVGGWCGELKLLGGGEGEKGWGAGIYRGSQCGLQPEEEVCFEYVCV
jgi:hypothetical protein